MKTVKQIESRLEELDLLRGLTLIADSERLNLLSHIIDEYKWILDKGIPDEYLIKLESGNVEEVTHLITSSFDNHDEPVMANPVYSISLTSHREDLDIPLTVETLAPYSTPLDT